MSIDDNRAKGVLCAWISRIVVDASAPVAEDRDGTVRDCAGLVKGGFLHIG